MCVAVQSFAHIIVELKDGRWLAWFEANGSFGGHGADPVEAIIDLLVANHMANAVERMVAIGEARRDGHLDFLVGFHGRRGIPVPSRN